MSKIARFEDLISWQKARELNRLIYRCARDGAFAKDSGLREQIRRASISVMSNIAEGFERDGDRELIQFLSVAKGSCGEVRAQLYAALDERYLSEPEFQKLYDMSVEVSRLIAGFMTYLAGSALRGNKFKQRTSA